MLTFKTNAQIRLLLNNDAYVRMENGVFVVLDNNNSNAITTTGSGGNIISENENNKIRWNTGTTTGTYIVPFSRLKSTITTKIPVTLAIDTAGAGAGGRIDFSTYETPDGVFGYENVPLPSMVTSFNNNTTDDSPYAIDRFWLIDANNYTTKPDVSITLTYIDDEHAAPNTITESSMKAQRFDEVTQNWNSGGNKLFGTINTTSNTVSNIKIDAADFFTAWTLTDNTSPLPVELISFSATCNNNNIELNWTTLSETSNDYFSIEKSYDGISFFGIGKITGSGNSNQEKNYSYIDNDVPVMAYYRLKQVDFNNAFEYSAIITSDCNTKPFSYHVFPNPSSGIFYIDLGTGSEFEQGHISNLLGELILNIEPDNQSRIIIDLSNFRDGVYLLTMIANGKREVEKLVKF